MLILVLLTIYRQIKVHMTCLQNRNDLSIFLPKNRHNLCKVINSDYNVNTNELYITLIKILSSLHNCHVNCAVENMSLMYFIF